MNYELFYLIGASREADTPKTKEEVKKIVEDAGGVFETKETQEKRKLAYKVKHETHGIYIAQRFELEETDHIKEINNKMNLHTGVLRFVISRTEDMPELKSKEERINEAAQRDSRTREFERKADVKKEKAAKPAQESPKKDESVTSDDIDKKLEEILNI